MTEEQSKVITATEFWQELQSLDLQHVRVVYARGRSGSSRRPVTNAVSIPTTSLPKAPPGRGVPRLSLVPTELLVKPAGCPPKTFEFSCRPPRKSSRPLESLQKTPYATSRNPRNGAALLAVPRLNLLCSLARSHMSISERSTRGCGSPPVN